MSSPVCFICYRLWLPMVIRVEVPRTVDELRHLLLDTGPAQGADANIADWLSADEYRRLFPAYTEIEPYWGPAPGELLRDSRGIRILGRQFGNVFVGVQPSFGYERDPMRLLLAKDAAPNHAFAAFYTWLIHKFRADAVIHLGTHGAMEFMPGKQVGLSARCWPLRLIGPIPNFYLYSVNNPSEAAIAKRRGAATLVSYLVPPVQQAGLYKGLRALRDAIDQYERRPDPALVSDLRERAAQLGIPMATSGDDYADVAGLAHELLRIEQRMIPVGLHVLGQPPTPAELADFLWLYANLQPDGGLPALIARGMGIDYADLCARLGSDLVAQSQMREIEALGRSAMLAYAEAPDVEAGARAATARLAQVVPAAQLKPFWPKLAELRTGLLTNHELQNLLHGLRGGFIPPSPSNDAVRNPAVLPTGRNLFALDPYRVPTPAAMQRGEALATELLTRLCSEQGGWPESIAIVLWGTDNLKSDCEGVAQVLALIGARPVVDELGNIADVTLRPLSELGRPRIDVVVTISGIFRDLLGNQMRLIDRAAYLAATADEPPEWNFVRAHVLAQVAEQRISLEEAAIRVFTNAPGSYGANVNFLVESGTWENDEQLSDAFLSRKSFVRTADGQWREARHLLEGALRHVQATFQNIDSFEVGLTDIDNYYESRRVLNDCVVRRHQCWLPMRSIHPAPVGWLRLKRCCVSKPAPSCSIQSGMKPCLPTALPGYVKLKPVSGIRMAGVQPPMRLKVGCTTRSQPLMPSMTPCASGWRRSTHRQPLASFVDCLKLPVVVSGRLTKRRSTACRKSTRTSKIVSKGLVKRGVSDELVEDDSARNAACRRCD
jgi:magnesium chelatase subunit H